MRRPTHFGGAASRLAPGAAAEDFGYAYALTLPSLIAMTQPQFVLKTTPPRLPRAAVARRGLGPLWETSQERTAVIVSAPRGFGKTTLLSQWRRAWLERGAFVAWVTLDAQDTSARLAEVLLTAVRAATGRGSFDLLAAELGSVQQGRESEALTALLAEIANLGTPTVLMLDDADRLPDATNEALSYLLYNAPPNLRLVIGARGPLPLSATDLVANGELAYVGVDELRLGLDDSVEILTRKFGPRITLDDCVRLHEITEGWPIGLQMAAATVERAAQLAPAIADLSARRGDLERFFLESMLSQLPGDVAALPGALLDTRVDVARPVRRGHAVAGGIAAPRAVDARYADRDRRRRPGLDPTAHAGA